MFRIFEQFHENRSWLLADNGQSFPNPVMEELPSCRQFVNELRNPGATRASKGQLGKSRLKMEARSPIRLPD
jgi:hypothetical protein